jgi:hypothetical protein
MLVMSDCLLEQDPDVGVVQGIEDVAAVAFANDQLKMTEQTKLM